MLGMFSFVLMKDVCCKSWCIGSCNDMASYWFNLSLMQD
jgi:hypothetical protein